MNSNDAKTLYNRVILKVNIFSKSSKKQPFSNLFKYIWNLSIDKKVVLMAAIRVPRNLCTNLTFKIDDLTPVCVHLLFYNVSASFVK